MDSPTYNTPERWYSMLYALAHRTGGEPKGGHPVYETERLRFARPERGEVVSSADV
jgi:hypothetical protein